MVNGGKVASRLFGAALILCAAAATARAKVIFSGYADLRDDVDTHGVIGGTPSGLGALGIPAPVDFYSRGFSADAIGLFATTDLRSDMQFLMDLTFRDVGQTVGETQLQYAYVDYTPFADTELKGGKVTLPFGYFNENRFYAFQRDTISAPFFQSEILGLPIADWGAVAQQRFPTKYFTFEASGYVINGYGNIVGQPNSFRDPLLPGGFAVSDSLAATNGNDKQAGGGRLRLTQIGGTNTEIGASFYEGLWNSAGTSPLQLGDVHFHTQFAGVDFLAEGLWMDVHGDQGFVKAIGDEDYHTLGYFATVSVPVATIRDMPLRAYLQSEYDRTSARNQAGHETLRNWSGGLAFKVNEHVTWKAEYLHLYYFLPFSAADGSLYITENTTTLSMVLSF